MKKTKGFAVVEGLLILVIIAILAGTGWYVRNTRNKTNNIYNSVNQVADSTVSTAKKTAQNNDPYAGWQTYANKKHGYSIKYPKGWSINLNGDPQNDAYFSVPAGSEGLDSRAVDNFSVQNPYPLSAHPSCFATNLDKSTDVTSSTNYSLGGEPAIKYLAHASPSDGSPVFSIIYTIVHSGNCYSLQMLTDSMHDRDSLSATSDLIAKSFTFIGQD